MSQTPPADFDGPSIPVPKGTYWVGDPCYAFQDSDGYVSAITNAQLNSPDGMLMLSTLPDLWFAGSLTSAGDGTYVGSDGRVYDVDCGMIAVCGIVEKRSTPEGMHRVSFAKPFSVWYDDRVIHLGHIAIETD